MYCHFEGGSNAHSDCAKFADERSATGERRFAALTERLAMTQSQIQGRFQTVVMTYFPMFIAVLSLATSLFNGYLNNKFVDIIQHNVERIEYLKTCKEIIDSYFQVKFRASLLNNHRDNLGASDLAEAGN